MTIVLSSKAFDAPIMFRCVGGADDDTRVFVEDPLVLQAESPLSSSLRSARYHLLLLALSARRDDDDVQLDGRPRTNAAFYLQLRLSQDYSISSAILGAYSSADLPRLARGSRELRSRKAHRLYQSDDFAVPPGLERFDMHRRRQTFDGSSRKAVKHFTKRSLLDAAEQLDMWTVENRQVYEETFGDFAAGTGTLFNGSWTPFADVIQRLRLLLLDFDAPEDQPCGSL